jgi:hypothetical protein
MLGNLRIIMNFHSRVSKPSFKRSQQHMQTRKPLHEASSTNPKMICMTQALWSVSSKNHLEIIKFLVPYNSVLCNAVKQFYAQNLSSELK